VADQLRCESVKRTRKRSELDDDHGKDASTDSTFGPIPMGFRNLHRKANSELFGSGESNSPGQKYSGFALLSDNDIDNPLPNDHMDKQSPPPEPSNSRQQ